MSGLSVSPLTSGDGGIVPGMLVHQAPGGAAATVVRAQADSLADSQGQLYVVEFSSTAPGGKVLADLAGRKRLLLETGLTPANGDALYLSATTAGCATNVPPAGIALGVGTIVDASTYAALSTVDATAGLAQLPPGVIAPGALITRAPSGGFLVGTDRTYVLSRALNYNYLDLLLTGGFGGLWAIAGPINSGNTDGSPYEYGNGFATRNVRIVANVQQNTLALGGGASPAVTFQVTRNGSLVPGAIVSIPPGVSHTGVFDSGEIAISGSIFASDTYGMFPTGFFPLGGVFTGNVTVQCYQ